MLLIFFLFSFSIAGLTLFALKSEGKNQAEIEITLSFMASNSKALIKNFKNLLTLLIKDVLSDLSIEKNKNTNKDLSNNLVNFENSKDFESNDLTLSEFSPNLMEIIEEEEEKIA